MNRKAKARQALLIGLLLGTLLGACGLPAGETTAPAAATTDPAAPTATPPPTATLSATRTPLPVPTHPPSVESFEDLAAMFDYTAGAPLDLQENMEGIKVCDITYDSPMGGKVTAYLVVPPGEGPFAGMLFMHGGTGSRNQFLPEALLLARMGAVSVVIDGPTARPEPWHKDSNPYDGANERAIDIQTIVDLRRAVDVLLSRPDVDPERIGFIGHSYGATQGGTLSGVEHRIKAYVLVASYPRYSDIYSPSMRTAFYIQEMESLDPIYYVPHAAPSALFFQYGIQDTSISAKLAQTYTDLASEPKLVKWYHAGHMISDEMYTDHLNWLAEHLGLDTSILKE